MSGILSLFAAFFFFFFNDTATTEIYTLSLHDALPISDDGRGGGAPADAPAVRRAAHLLAAGPRPQRGGGDVGAREPDRDRAPDRKSTRLNSSHLVISYAVFCLKKKKKHRTDLKECVHC